MSIQCWLFFSHDWYKNIGKFSLTMAQNFTINIYTVKWDSVFAKWCYKFMISISWEWDQCQCKIECIKVSSWVQFWIIDQITESTATHHSTKYIINWQEINKCIQSRRKKVFSGPILLIYSYFFSVLLNDVFRTWKLPLIAFVDRKIDIFSKIIFISTIIPCCDSILLENTQLIQISSTDTQTYLNLIT